jgi:molecular chaperone DnaJ
VSAIESLPVDVPAGVADGVDLRVTGAGHAGRAGGPSGDVYLSVRVAEDEVFERRGNDLFAVIEVPMVQAALGVEIELESLDGVERIQLEPGTPSGTIVRLRGKGMPNLGRRGRGDLYLTIQVETPRDVKRDERRLLEQLADLRGEPVGKRASVPARLRRPTNG